jgi:hypothetical protein
MKPIVLGLALVAAMALPASQALAGACGGGPIDTPDAMASHVVLDINYGIDTPDALAYAEAQFDPALSAVMPQAALANSWRAYQEPRGAFQSIGEMSDEVRGELTVVQVPVQFANGAGVVQVSVHSDLTVAGLAFLPH